MSESVIRDSIVEYLKKRGVLCWKDKQVLNPRVKGFPRYQKGLPDIMGVLPGGKFLGIEVKTKTGKLSKEQDEFLKQSLSLGAIVGVARSIDDVEKILKSLEI